MEFNFNATSMSFSMARIQNQVNMSSFCFRCTRIAFQTWSQLQVSCAGADDTYCSSVSSRELLIPYHRSQAPQRSGHWW